jgi:Flp pilus assembly pilin Flp
MLGRFFRDDSGATAIEYATIASLLSILVYTGATSVGRTLADKQIDALLRAWVKA